jgi:hypothetical protein
LSDKHTAASLTPPAAPEGARAKALRKIITRVVNETFAACEVAEGFGVGQSDWGIDGKAIVDRALATLEVSNAVG